MNVVLPAMGEGIIEATVNKWLVKEGSAVKEDDPIVEVATDKVDSEVPSPASGTIVRIIAVEGTVAKVGDIITIKAKMTRAFSSSMEIFVQAWSKKVVSQKAYLINEAYFTFVAIDDYGNPCEIGGLRPTTIEEKKQHIGAVKRKKHRLNN